MRGLRRVEHVERVRRGAGEIRRRGQAHRLRGRGAGAGRPETRLVLPVPGARLWCPDDPHLHRLQVRLLREGRVLDEIDPDAEIFVICRTSGRSFRMLEYFEHVGYDAVCVEGGMVAWEAGGKPVVTWE